MVTELDRDFNMRPYVLVGSSSPSRQRHYKSELERHGFYVHVVPGGVDCLRDLAVRTPGILLLEYSLLRGTAEGIPDVTSEDSDWRNVPVVLLASCGVNADACRLARFPIIGFFERFPAGHELVDAIRSAIQSAEDPFVAAPFSDQAYCS